MSQITVEDNPVAEASMSAVIVYNNFFGANKARALLQRASHRADATLKWTIKAIHLDQLSRPLSAEAALNGAADAHLMLIALRHPLWVPSKLRDWLEVWAQYRRVPDAALAVWNGVNGDTLSPAAAPDLSSFAARHGLSFISDIAASVEEESGVCGFDRPEHEVYSEPTVQHMLQQALGPLYEKAVVNA